MKSFNSISSEEMEKFSEACNCIQRNSASSGRGLSTGEKIDFFLTKQFLPANLGREFEEFHEDESDFKILNQPISFKTLREGGDLAMCWSRNDGTESQKETKICRHWQVPVLIYVRESGKWWSNGPMKDCHTKEPFESSEKKYWCQKIRSGFYLINHTIGDKINFKKNNKSTCIIDKQDVYRLIIDAKEKENFLEMPEPQGIFPTMKFVFEDFDGDIYSI